MKPWLQKDAGPGATATERKETFVGAALTPEGPSFSACAMAMGSPGLPGAFSWNGRKCTVTEVVEQWKEAGDCRHGSGERYVRKHWFRVRTGEGLEMRIYFERQARSSGGSRWRLFSVRESRPSDAAERASTTKGA